MEWREEGGGGRIKNGERRGKKIEEGIKSGERRGEEGEERIKCGE